MTSISKTGTLILLGVMGTATMSCDNEAVTGAEGGGVPATGVVGSALLSGAGNLSDGYIAGSVAESETAAAELGSGSFVVAYNVVPVPTPGERCFGYSGLGMSFNAYRAGFQAIHFTTPSNMGALVSDPSVAVADLGGSWNVYVSVLAESATKWNNAPKTHDNCVSQTTWEGIGPDYVCVFTVNIAKLNGGASGAQVTNVLCQGGGLDVDGTAVTAANGTFYVATYSNPFMVLFTGNNVPYIVPFGTTNSAMIGHPIWMKNSPLDMIAPAPDGTFWWITYHPSTASWSTSTSTAGGYAWGGSLPYGVRGGKDYAAAYLPGSAGPGAYYLFYRKGSQIVGYAHSSGGIPGWTQVYASDSRYQAFRPAVAIATVPNQYPPYTGFHLGLTYWDSSGPGGTAAMRYTTTLSGTAATLGGSQTPCPSFDGYWGDYDEMFVQGDFSPSYYFTRAFTDSTKQACSPGSDWSPSTVQHVSIITPPGGH